MGNTPAFQYYPADLISDPEVMFWDMEQVGCYWQMITFLWLNEGKFEYKIENLCKLFRKNHKKIAKKLWNNIEIKFIIKDGFVTHKRVTKEIEKQAAKRVARQVAGQKGGNAKASNAKDLLVAKPSTSSSTSVSSSLKEKNKRKTTTPDEFLITEQMIEYASSKKYFSGLEDLTEDFLIHHRKKGSKFVCWYSAWQSWLRNQIKWYGIPENNSNESDADKTKRELNDKLN